MLNDHVILVFVLSNWLIILSHSVCCNCISRSSLKRMRVLVKSHYTRKLTKSVRKEKEGSEKKNFKKDKKVKTGLVKLYKKVGRRGCNKHLLKLKYTICIRGRTISNYLEQACNTCWMYCLFMGEGVDLLLCKESLGMARDILVSCYLCGEWEGKWRRGKFWSVCP